MFDRVVIHASDLAESLRFYRAVLPTLGVVEGSEPDGSARFGELVIVKAAGERPVTRRLHVGLAAASAADIMAFWQAGTSAGFRDDGAPGPRPQYSAAYRGGFLLDPDGNSIEAAWHENIRSRGAVDHVWVRVADFAAVRAEYRPAADAAGLQLVHDEPGISRFRGPDRGSVTILTDPTGSATSGADLTVGSTRFTERGA